MPMSTIATCRNAVEARFMNGAALMPFNTALLGCAEQMRVNGRHLIGLGRAFGQVPQHVVQNAAVAEIIELVERVDRHA